MTRCLHLISGLRIGGKERVALELCRRGRAAGHDDALLLFLHPRSGGPEELAAEDVAVHSLASADASRLARLAALRRALAELKPRVIHAHNDSALYLASLAGGSARRITTLHNMPVGLGQRHRLAVRLLARRQDHVVCVSEELREARLRAGWIRRAQVIPNGVDLARFRPQGPARNLHAEMGLASDTLLIGMVARFDSGKRQRELVSAAADLARGGRKLALAFAGDGPTRSALLAGLPEGLPVLSLPQVADMPAFLRGLDALVLASDHEGLPMSLLEAMACGVPVAASDVGGIPELLDGGTAGLLFRGSGELLQALESLADPARRLPLARAAAQRAAEHYSLDRSAELYGKLLS